MPSPRPLRRRLLLQQGAALLLADALPETLPDWVPRQGGTLAVLPAHNDFLSQNARLPGWEHAFGSLIDDYSGGVFNPFWGPLGAMVFHGGGHSATFDNSVVLLDLNDLCFKRVSQPTPAQQGRNWARASAGVPDAALDVAHCEYGNGQPGAGHSYDSLAILPPAAGGAACGSLLRVASFAVHVNASCNTGWAHRFDFHSTDMRDGLWRRASRNAPQTYLAPGGCSAWDGLRRRVWWLASLGSLPGHVRYLEPATGAQVQIELDPKAARAPPLDSDSATMRHDARHDLLLLSGTVGGAMVLAALRCEEPAAGWFVPQLSQPMPARPNASLAFDWVPALDAYLMQCPADAHALYQLRLPGALRQVWTLQRQALGPLALPQARVVGKRWSYCQAADCFVWLASSHAPVLVYRPAR